MPTMKSAEDMLATELRAIHSAEQQLSRSIPKLVKKANSDRLKKMMKTRLELGEEIIDEIERSLDGMDAKIKGRTRNAAAEGLLEDVGLHLDEIKEDKLIDPFLLAAMQKIEHYCIASWGTAAAMARMMEHEQVVDAMERALDEGKRFDRQMTLLAEEEINPMMLEGEEEMEEEEDAGQRWGERRPQSQARSWARR